MAVQMLVRRSTTDEAEFVLEIKPASDEIAAEMLGGTSDTSAEPEPEPEPQPEPQPQPQPERVSRSAAVAPSSKRKNDVSVRFPDLEISFDAFDHDGSIHDSRLSEDEFNELKGEKLFTVTLTNLDVKVAIEGAERTISMGIEDIEVLSDGRSYRWFLCVLLVLYSTVSFSAKTKNDRFFLC